MLAKPFQSCPTLCDPMDCSLLASSVRGDSPVKILEWVAIPSSRGSSQPGDLPSLGIEPTSLLPLVPPGNPIYGIIFYINMTRAESILNAL